MAAKTANLYARIEPNVKEQAESILSALGIPVSNAITCSTSKLSFSAGSRLMLSSLQQSPPTLKIWTRNSFMRNSRKGMQT